MVRVVESLKVMRTRSPAPGTVPVDQLTRRLQLPPDGRIHETVAARALQAASPIVKGAAAAAAANSRPGARRVRRRKKIDPMRADADMAWPPTPVGDQEELEVSDMNIQQAPKARHLKTWDAWEG